MAKNIKDTETGSEELLANTSSTDVLSVKNVTEDTEVQGTDSDPGTDENIDDGLVGVVVLKGHTLYHDGEKYPPTSRVSMSPEDADRLKKRGVVMLYSELLEQVAGYAG